MGFPKWMRKVHGKSVGWKCEECGRRWKDGWMLEFHHINPTSNGGEDTFDNIQCLCLFCHYEAHVNLRIKGIDHPASASLIMDRIARTGGRNKNWRRGNGQIRGGRGVLSKKDKGSQKGAGKQSRFL